MNATIPETVNRNNFTATLLVNQDTDEVYHSINNVRGWWSTLLEGSSENLNDVFRYRHKEIHDTTQKVIELIPGKRIVWLVTEANLSFAEKKDEWKNTLISFDISKEDDKTKIIFIHHGLIPELTCYKSCQGGWNHYLKGSLYQLITTGHGQPD